MKIKPSLTKINWENFIANMIKWELNRDLPRLTEKTLYIANKIKWELDQDYPRLTEKIL